MYHPFENPVPLILLFLAIYVGFFLFVLLVNYVLYGIAMSRFFPGVGIEAWVGWVPYYRYWKWLELGGQKGWLSLLSLIPYGGIVTSVFLYIGMWHTGKAFSKGAGMLVLGIFLPFAWLFVLSGRDEVYRPELIAAAGFSPPLAGYGSAVYAAVHPDTSAGPTVS